MKNDLTRCLIIDDEPLGIKLIRTHLEKLENFVIITTAYREYAIEGYDLDIVDFLLKPVSFERFLKAINRYCSRTRTSLLKDGTGSGEMAEKKYLFIQDGKNTFKLLYDDIVYFEGYGEYVKVITTNKNYLVRDTLAEFEHKLSSDFFLRIHKSYLINIRKILGFSTIHIMVKNCELPIGRVYREKVMKMLKAGTTL